MKAARNGRRLATRHRVARAALTLAVHLSVGAMFTYALLAG